MLVSDYTVEKIKSLKGDELAAVGALRYVKGKDNEFICPFEDCNNGEGRDATGIKPNPHDTTHTGWKCHKCGREFDNVHILAEYYGLHYQRDFKEICQRACDDFGIEYEEDKPYQKQSKPKNQKINPKQGEYSTMETKSPLQKPANPDSGELSLVYSSANNKSEPTQEQIRIRHSVLGIINQDLAADVQHLKNFVDPQGGKWRGLPFELLKKHSCRFIQNWIHPNTLVKRPDAKNWATLSPRLLIPAATDLAHANYLARLTVPIENFTAEQRNFLHEKDHAGTKSLFNADLLSTAELVIAVEGYVDALSLELVGFDAVATGGADGYELLVNAVADLEHKPQILILFDPDKTGRDIAPKLQRALTKIGCVSAVRFLADSECKLDANQILVDNGVDVLRGTVQKIVADVQDEFNAFEEKIVATNAKASSAPMCDDQLALTAKQCKNIFSGDLSELDNARRLEYLFGDRLRYLQDCDRWLTYSAGIWNKALKSQNSCLYPFTVKAAEILKANAADGDERKIAAAFKRKSIRDSFAFLKGLDSIIIKQADLDNHPQLLNCLNGVVDLETGKLMQASPELLITQKCAAAYTGKRNETVDKFLRDIQPDEQTLAALIRWLGYCSTGLVNEEKAFLFYGSGGNGKGTLTLLLMNLFADYATSLPVTAVCEAGRMSDAGAATTELNVLEKIRLAIVEELPQGRKLDTAKFKLLTGGDKIPIRRLHEEFTMINPTHKIIISGNYRPELSDARDDGLIRRLHSVDFLQKFTDQNRDPLLKSRLLAQDALNGLLTLLVDAAVTWFKHGLIFSAAIENSTRNYFDQNDFLSAFIVEFCEYGDGKFIELNSFVKRLKEEYPDETRLIPERHLKDMLKKLDGKNGIQYRRVGEKSRFGLAGIGYKDGATQQSFEDFQSYQ